MITLFNRTGMFLLISISFVATIMTGCAHIGTLSDNRSFTTTIRCTLKEAKPNLLDIIEDVGKELGYYVSDVNHLKRTITLTQESSMITTVLVGKVSTAKVIFATDESGKIFDVGVIVVGNFGTGDQDTAKKIIETFKAKLEPRLPDGMCTK